MNNIKVLSGLKLYSFIPWIGIWSILLSYSIHRELIGSGINTSTFFNLFGYFLYPMYYGGILYIIYRFSILFSFVKVYIYLLDDKLIIGRNRPISANSIDFIKMSRNSLGIKNISICDNKGYVKKIWVYSLSCPGYEVFSSLLSWKNSVS